MKGTGLVILLSLQYIPDPQCSSWTLPIPSFLFFCWVLVRIKNCAVLILIFEMCIFPSSSCYFCAWILAVLFGGCKIIFGDHV